MKHFYNLITSNENLLLEQVGEIIKKNLYCPEIMLLHENQQVTIDVVCREITNYLEYVGELAEIKFDFQEKLGAVDLGIRVAQTQIGIGVTQNTLISTLKIIRKSFSGLIHQADFDTRYQAYCQEFILDFFDHLEIGVLHHYASISGQELLVESEGKFKLLFEKSVDALFLLEENCFIDCNQAALDLFNCENKEQMRGYPYDFSSERQPDGSNSREKAREKIMEAYIKGNVRFEWTYQDLCGSQFLADMTLVAMPWNHKRILFSICRDITDKRKAEEQLFEFEKMESIGLLAGGIAHDFNNYLTIIMGNTSLAKRFTAKDQKIYSRLLEVEKASLQAKELTQQLLTFAKGGLPVKKIESLAQLLEDTVDFSTCGFQGLCELNIAHDLWLANIDNGQISQVISNLIINAEQAMPEGGLIKVSAINHLVSDGAYQQLTSGKYVKIVIEDNGVGINAENIIKIFDPYFTTKEHGTGLGLSTAYSIVRKHDGLIEVESIEGEGTKFTIFLPAYGKGEPGQEFLTEEMVLGQGRILVMDDDEKIISMLEQMLTHLGYEPSFAKEGQEAIDLYCKSLENSQLFDMVILDLTIPGGMGGQETAKRLRQINPEVKVIVSSGYSQNLLLTNYLDYGYDNVIVKPYKIEELSSVLYQVLSNESCIQAI